MTHLKRGDRVEFTRHAISQFPQAQSRCGVVVNSAWDRGQGKQLPPNIVTVLRDGLKSVSRWHHTFWKRAKP